MNRYRLLCLSGLVALAGCSSLPQLRTPVGDEDLARQIVVAVPQSRELSTALLGAPDQRYRLRRGYGAAPEVERTLQQLAREHDMTRVGGWPIASLDVYCEIFAVRPGASVDALLSRLSADSRVDLAQRMNVFETLSGAYDDTYADLQLSMAELELEAAHRVATGRGVTVAVIDSGVDAGHPELNERVMLVRDLVGSVRMPPEGEVHGTAVAGVIGSAANNAEGIVGVAPEASIASLRACWPSVPGGAQARCSTLSIAQALELALDMRPHVINLSLNGPHDPLLARLMERIVDRGIVVVTAGPEGGAERGGFPSSQPGVLVAERSSAARPGAGGDAWLVSAPGEEILTTMPAADYAFMSGSSLAAAHVSGVAALLLERRPAMAAGQIARTLRDSASYPPGRTSVNACRALASLTVRAACGTGGRVVSYDPRSRTTD